MWGLGGNQLHATFPEPFDQYLLKAYNSIMDPSDSAMELIMLVNKFELTEVEAGALQYGYFEMEFEFAVNRNGYLQSKGIYEVIQSTGGIDASKSYDDLIIDGLKKSLRLLPYINMYTGQRDTISITSIDIDSKIWKAPKPGLYNSFTSVLFEQPLIESGFELEQAEGRSNHPSFYINTELDNELVSLLLFASDGETLFMQGARSHTSNLFLPVLEFGPILLFEDVVSDPNAAMALGFIGTAVSTKGRAVVLDTRTRESKRLTDYVLYHLSKDFPKILKNYRKSKRKLEDKHKLISDLNIAILADGED